MEYGEGREHSQQQLYMQLYIYNTMEVESIHNFIMLKYIREHHHHHLYNTIYQLPIFDGLYVGLGEGAYVGYRQMGTGARVGVDENPC